MANDSLLIGSAIYSKLSAGTLNVYHWLGPQGGTPPYCVYNRMAAVDEYTFGTGHGVNADYLIKVVSNRDWPGEAQSAYTAIHNLIQDAALSISGMTSIRCRRKSTIEYRDPDGYWHVGGVYRVEAWS